MNKFFSVLTWPFRKVFDLLKKAGPALGLVADGLEIVGTFALENLPDDFVADLVAIIVDLELTDLTGAEKRKEFLYEAEQKAKDIGIEWTESIARALLEVLLARLKGVE